MQIKRFIDFDKTKYEKYVNFTGRILIIGYGSVGQAILPLVLRHIVVDPKNITVLERDNHRQHFIKRHGGSGVNYVRQEIKPTNYKKEIGKYASKGDLIINCSLNIDAKSLLIWCMDNDVMQIDTSLERWENHPDETIPKLSDRTLYHTHKVIREAMSEYPEGPTLCVTHGANPGYVTHLTKRGLLNLAKKKGKKVTTPTTQEEWAQLMKSLGVKVVHVAERDQQVIDEPKTKNEFANTWSCEGFWAEGRAPAEMGWGTHEDKHPEGGRSQGNAAYLLQPGACTMMKSWVPDGGQYNGYCIQHSESITISEYFTTSNGKYRPSVYYVYQPSDAAIASLHEMRGNELDLQRDQRILKDEIVAGIDELGVLLIGDDFAFWHGSQLDIHGARDLIEGENATSVQVAGSLLGAIVWMIKNPRNGYTEPEEVPFEEIMKIGDMYWNPIVSVMSNWTPNKDVNSLFYKEYDASNPCKYENFRVWT
jgi:homospermidine synthase